MLIFFLAFQILFDINEAFRFNKDSILDIKKRTRWQPNDHCKIKLKKKKSIKAKSVKDIHSTLTLESQLWKRVSLFFHLKLETCLSHSWDVKKFGEMCFLLILISINTTWFQSRILWNGNSTSKTLQGIVLFSRYSNLSENRNYFSQADSQEPNLKDSQSKFQTKRVWYC